MPHKLAQRAADELNADELASIWQPTDTTSAAFKTVMRLLARIDELEAQPTRRSEPMPEPVPEWLRELAWKEYRRDFPFAAAAVFTTHLCHAYARLIWERGDREPVDPVEALAEELLANYEYKHRGTVEHNMVREAIKRGMELAKEIG